MFINRLLESLQEFLDKVEVEENGNSTTNSTKTVFTFETFALQVQEVNPEGYSGQMFNVYLGSLEKARENNQTIEQAALVTSNIESTKQDKSDNTNVLLIVQHHCSSQKIF